MIPTKPSGYSAPHRLPEWSVKFWGGHWHAFDARHNCRRIGRIPVARGRDAADVPITMTFGKSCLKNFSVTTEELDPSSFGALADFGKIQVPAVKDQKTLFSVR